MAVWLLMLKPPNLIPPTFLHAQYLNDVTLVSFAHIAVATPLTSILAVFVVGIDGAVEVLEERKRSASRQRELLVINRKGAKIGRRESERLPQKRIESALNTDKGKVQLHTRTKSSDWKVRRRKWTHQSRQAFL